MLTPRLYLEAARNARPRQLFARAVRPINRRRTRFSSAPTIFRPIQAAGDLWRSAAFSAANIVADQLPEGEIDLLGRSVPYPPRDWAGTGLEGLRRFQLNYGEEILGCARQGGDDYLAAAQAGLEAWIESNPPGSNESWHPYALATRVGNWIAAASLEPSLATPALTQSLWRQLTYLERNVENDILGNHLIRNARALVLGGVAFEADGILARGLRLLDRELSEQVLADGGHYERSPTYHAIVLRDLLEIRAATESSRFAPVIERMKAFAAGLIRPDGVPALFNDGGIDLAPDLRSRLPQPPHGLVVFPETGYAVLRNDAMWLAFDCGLAAPPFLPPHAHADALSFQLWLRGSPVVVDPGTFTYEAGALRDRFRGTSAHATLSVDGADQFQFVGAFRALGIPRVRLLEASGSASEGTIAAEFEGFRHVARGLRHSRSISWSKDELWIEDRIDGRGNHMLENTLPLAPEIEIESNGAVCAGGVEIRATGPLGPVVEEGTVSERFFQSVAAPVLVARGEAALPTALGWHMRLPH